MIAPAVRAVLAAAVLGLCAAAAGAQPKVEEGFGFEFGLRGGFREDDIRVTTANSFGGDFTFDVRDANIHDLEIFGRARIKEGFYYRGSISFGWYYDGFLTIDETGDDGPLSFDPLLGIVPFAATGTVDGNTLFDATGGLGYQLSLFKDRLRIAPLAGYSFHKNDVEASSTTLTRIDGIQTSSTYLAFSIDTTWSGPWVGFDLTGFITPRFTAIAGVEHHWVDLVADGGFSSDGDETRARGKGTGFSYFGGLRYRFTKIFTAEVLYQGHDWSANTGSDLAFSWTTYRVTAGGLFHF